MPMIYDVPSLIAGRQAVVACLHLTWNLRNYVRTANLIERVFIKERRTRFGPRFFTMKSCLELVYDVFIRVANWR